jgi:hypothetical protein
MYPYSTCDVWTSWCTWSSCVFPSGSLPEMFNLSESLDFKLNNVAQYQPSLFAYKNRLVRKPCVVAEKDQTKAVYLDVEICEENISWTLNGDE